jgi:hypothetical protein
MIVTRKTDDADHGQLPRDGFFPLWTASLQEKGWTVRIPERMGVPRFIGALPLVIAQTTLFHL